MVRELVRNVVLAGVFLVSGCVTRYSDVSEGAPHAVMEFGRGAERGGVFTNGVMQEYSLSAPTNEDCDNIDRAALFTSLNAESETSRRVLAGSPLRVYVSTEFLGPTRMTSSGADGFTVQLDIDACVAQALFSPQEGHSYSVVHRVSEARSCALEVVDVSTGSAPPDLSVVNDAGCVSGRAVGPAPGKPPQ